MKKIIIIWILALMPVVSFSQSGVDPILGNWQAIEYENLKTGEITFGEEGKGQDVIIRFSANNSFISNTCNSVGGKYRIRKDSLFMEAGAHHYGGCEGWKGMVETIISSSSQKLIYRINNGRMETEAENKFILILYQI